MDAGRSRCTERAGQAAEDFVARMRDVIETKLTDAFRPKRLAIVDESALHTGHAGARPDGESHFRVEIVSPLFEGKSRVERQRMVYGALKEEMASRIHALSLTVLTPAEDGWST